MSSATDVLMYVDPQDDSTMDLDFNRRMSDVARFEAHPFRVDTDDWSGPNVFGGHVWAFGADFLTADDVQDVMNATRWKFPHRVVAIVNWVDGDGPCETVVCRPRYEIGPGDYGGWYGDHTVRQLGPEDDQ